MSNDDPPGFLQVAWRRAPPRALWPSPPTFAFKSFPTSWLLKLAFSFTSLICYLALFSPFVDTFCPSFCPHLLSSLHPSFPPPFVPLSRSEEGLSGVSCASRRSRPHLARGFLLLLSVTHYRNKEACKFQDMELL